MNSELQAELQRSIEGEVRFDTISRALYSTDASVYQIQPGRGRDSQDAPGHHPYRRDLPQHRCPITMRGGGTSQAGQAIGEGLQVDISKYYNQLLEVNAEERWARVEPGIVLDELNAQLAPLGCASRPIFPPPAAPPSAA